MAARRLSILLSHLKHDSPIRSCSDRHPGSLDLVPLSSDSYCTVPKLQHDAKPISNNGDKSSKLPFSESSDEEKTCTFCMIVRDEAPALKLYEDDICLCILDTSPLSKGHSLIIPKSHFRSLEATPPSVVAALCSVVPLLSKVIMKATHCVCKSHGGNTKFTSDCFYVDISGATAFTIYKWMCLCSTALTHVHLIPRKTHDHLWTSASLRRRHLLLNEDASLLADDIRRLLSQTSKKCSDCKIEHSTPCLTACDACTCAGKSHKTSQR